MWSIIWLFPEEGLTQQFPPEIILDIGNCRANELCLDRLSFSEGKIEESAKMVFILLLDTLGYYTIFLKGLSLYRPFG